MQVSEEASIARGRERVWLLVSEARHFARWDGSGGATTDLRPGGEHTWGQAC